MTWYMNFCAPFIPNDPTINFHRFVQGILLLLYSLMYAGVHFYYMYYGPLPLVPEDEHDKQNQKESKEEHESQNSQNSSENKEVSIKLEEQPNDSCIQLKKTGATWNQKSGKSTDKDGNIIESVTLQEIQDYNPIVFGHFIIAVGLSIMYTPYAEQTIAILLYILLTIPLLIVNSKRMVGTTRFIFTQMVLLLFFLYTCGLLQVGQSNWDILNLDCFSNEYQSLYS